MVPLWLATLSKESSSLVLSLIRPLGFLFFRECLHTDLLILAAEQCLEDSSFILDSFSDTEVLALVDDFLRCDDSNLGITCDFRCCLQCAIQDFFVSSVKCFGSKTPLLSFFSAKILASQDQFHCFALPNCSCQSL